MSSQLIVPRTEYQARYMAPWHSAWDRSQARATVPIIEPEQRVHVSSVNASKGAFGQTNYSAAKAGHGFKKALALEVARKGVTVNHFAGYTEMVVAMLRETKYWKRRSLRRFTSVDSVGGKQSPRWLCIRVPTTRPSLPGRISPSTAVSICNKESAAFR